MKAACQMAVLEFRKISRIQWDLFFIMCCLVRYAEKDFREVVAVMKIAAGGGP